MRFIRLILALWPLLSCQPAYAAGVCAPYDALAGALAQRYGEIPSGVGLMPDGNALEIFAAPSGSWTLVIVKPTGVGCVAASGVAWTANFAPVGDPT